MRMKIIGKKCVLRRFRMCDAQSIYENINDKAIYRYTLRIPYPYKFKDAKKFIRKSSYEWKKEKSFRFGIEIDKKVVGCISLEKVDQTHKNAGIGYWLGKKHWSRGVMTEAVKLILGFAFKDLKLIRVYGCVLSPNKASARVLEKAGFKYEGTTRKGVCKDGKPYDHLCYGILKEEYEK